MKRLRMLLLFVICLPLLPILGITRMQVSAITALGDTAKTSLGNITLPSNARRIVGFWAYCTGGPGYTTLENQTGICEIESDDMNIVPLQFPFEGAGGLTGDSNLPNKVWPVDIPVRGKETLKGYGTMDMAITLANTGRWGVITDVAG